jgi:hypothetical protein
MQCRKIQQKKQVPAASAILSSSAGYFEMLSRKRGIITVTSSPYPLLNRRPFLRFNIHRMWAFARLSSQADGKTPLLLGMLLAAPLVVEGSLER